MPSSAATERTRERELDPRLTSLALCRSLRARGGPAVLLEGHAFEDAWGPLVALAPRVLEEVPASAAGDVDGALERLDAAVLARRARGGAGGSGIVVLIAYDLFSAGERRDDSVPRLVVLAVDASLRVLPGGRARVESVREDPRSYDALLGELAAGALEGDAAQRSRQGRALVTSLPRARYALAVERVLEHIRRGDIYQANLTQRFEVRSDADPLDVYEDLARATPAPRAAYVETPSLALASASPELFLRIDPGGRIETWPIKGTRTRQANPEDDAQAARNLLASEKDRAELTMIVDLERNDLGRVCTTGSIRASDPVLRTFPAVHHLVACVEGVLAAGTRPSELLRAVFPGGSITGAPKIRAMEILEELEPVGRGLYTGSLFWFGDDSFTDSSILIRSAVMVGERAWVGAGGGVVAESDPEGEWRESNDKARALLGAFGFAPEEAS